MCVSWCRRLLSLEPKRREKHLLRDLAVTGYFGYPGRCVFGASRALGGRDEYEAASGIVQTFGVASGGGLSGSG